MRRSGVPEVATKQSKRAIKSNKEADQEANLQIMDAKVLLRYLKDKYMRQLDLVWFFK